MARRTAPQTKVYKLSVALGGETSPERIEGTMQDRLAEELVQEMIEQEIGEEKLETQSHVVLLLNLGSLYPFTRASELLDELDRRNVRSTIGIPFPGDDVGGKLSFFDGDSRHYYPAHQIDGQIREGTSPTMSIRNLFRSDPTRQLEEVQKVNARERAETDVVEFYETKSAERVLTELGEVTETHPGEARSLPLSPRDVRVREDALAEAHRPRRRQRIRVRPLGYRTRRAVAWVRRQLGPIDRRLTRRTSQTGLLEPP